LRTGFSTTISFPFLFSRPISIRQKLEHLVSVERLRLRCDRRRCAAAWAARGVGAMAQRRRWRGVARPLLAAEVCACGVWRRRRVRAAQVGGAQRAAQMALQWLHGGAYGARRRQRKRGRAEARRCDGSSGGGLSWAKHRGSEAGGAGAREIYDMWAPRIFLSPVDPMLRV